MFIVHMHTCTMCYCIVYKFSRHVDFGSYKLKDFTILFSRITCPSKILLMFCAHGYEYFKRRSFKKSEFDMPKLL